MALLTVENLSFTYPEAGEKALCDVSLSVDRGEFITLMGATGSGKSTLLRLLKPELRQNGAITGRIRYSASRSAPLVQSFGHLSQTAPFTKGSLDVGADIAALSGKESAARLGYVAQNPEEQIVTDKVWHELAFTLENLGAKRELIARRIAEISSFFGIDGWYHRDTATLSGGQKQLLNLAAVMTADPDILLLDEPTSQLDPVAATRFIETVYRLNRETGLTVLICEHRAEELLPISDRVVILDSGRIAYDGEVRKLAQGVGENSPYFSFLPTAARIARAVGSADVPLSIREGQRFIETIPNQIHTIPTAPIAEKRATTLEIKSVFFRYERNGADVLSDLSLTVREGETFALLGANGAGKSTAAAVAAGLRRAYSGSVKLFGKRLRDYKNGSLYQGCLSLLPQDVESVFIHEKVGEELKGCEAAVELISYDLKPLYSRHPYDLSGGERQLVALCKALSTSPRFLIMDEPSKGLDGNIKTVLCGVIRRLKQSGVTVLLITHDVEFAALCADRCALFAQGQVAACDDTAAFMRDNRFYTTAASRITRSRFDDAFTVDRAAELIRLNGGAV